MSIFYYIYGAILAESNSNPSPSAMISAEFVYQTDPVFFMFIEQESLFFF